MTKIFAYGSLVNTKTWSFDTEYEKTTLLGWVRQWRMITETDKRKVCALTISPQKESFIDGILIKTNSSMQSKIDKREYRYKKIAIEKEEFNIKMNNFTGDYKILCYISEKSSCNWASDDTPILQSYIDVIADGYYQIFGEDGFRNFFKSTEGWHLPILNDRDNPQYSRALNLDKRFLEKVDNQIQTILRKR